ncbi:MAG TPA: winged helix-turn-helix domain-containing protein [Pyrinomonadaceae bacterium]|nr:winged helix-turn-helix domain-containing protein [Pyrinomonadaceae bacterium]
MSLETHEFEFGEFVLDRREKVLLQVGKPVPITPKIFDLLLILLENRGHVVEKATLMNKVWAGSFVEESNLTFSIRQLRKVLGDDAHDPRYIETIPRRGYRFIASNGVEDSRETSGSLSARGGTSIAFADLFDPNNRRRLVSLSFVLGILCLTLLTAAIFRWRENRSAAQGSFLSSSSGLKLESISSSSNPITASISKDGRLIAYSSIANGQQSLWLRQVSSGINTQIVAPERGVTFHSIRFSGNGEYIYFIRRFKDDPTHLDRVSILGGAVKENILSDLDGTFSLTDDDRLISYRRYEPGKRSLVVANIDGSEARTVHETSKTFTDNVFSPDGKRIAFASGQSDTGDQDFGVYLLDVENSEVRSATDFRWYHVRGIIWRPDQNGLLVTAAARGGQSMQLWTISLPSGVVKRITDTQSSFSTISATEDLSKILLTQVSGSSNIYLTSLGSPDNIRPLAEASDGVAWSPDGDLVYSSSSGGNSDIWSLDSDMVTRKQLTTEDAVDYDPQVSPDGRHIIFISNRNGKYNVWRMNFDGREPVQLTNGEGEQHPTFTPDGRFVVFNSVKDLSLRQVPVLGGASTQLSDKRCRNVSISPDGKQFAHFARSGEDLVAVVKKFPAGEVIKEFSVPDGYFAGSALSWSKDGRSLIYAAHDGNTIGNLWQQELSGGPPVKITNYSSDEIFYFATSPDGLSLALVRGSWKHEVVLARTQTE